MRELPVASTADWIAGARPRTLPMAVCPVLIGAAAAWAGNPPPWSFATVGAMPWGFEVITLMVMVLALVVALALQVGVNYANDYSDGIRGTDDARVGPMRLTGSGAAPAAAVKRAAFLSFGVAGLAGLGIVLLSGQWWMIAVGVVCVVAAWWYTGGRNPYGYLGLGEIMVFIFFGLVATLGTTYGVVASAEQAGYEVSFPWAESMVGAVAHGLIAAALLMANNIRDIPTDRESGKMTVAVRMGTVQARWAYCLMVAVAVASPLALVLVEGQVWFLLVIISWPMAIRPVATMWPWRTQRPEGRHLIPVLQQTGMVGLSFAATYSAALLLSA